MGLRSINIFNFINPHYSAINNHKPSCQTKKRGFKSVVFFPKHLLFHKTNIPFQNCTIQISFLNECKSVN